MTTSRLRITLAVALGLLGLLVAPASVGFALDRAPDVMVSTSAPNAPTTLNAFINALGSWPVIGGFVPSLPGKVYAAKYLTDLSCKTDQTANLNAAAAAAGKGGLVELPSGNILASSVATLAGQVWRGNGASFIDGSQYDAGLASSGGTTFCYAQPTGAALTLVGSGASVRGVAFVDTYSGSATKTSTAVQFGDSSGPSNTASGNPEGQGAYDVRVYGFNDEIDVQSGEFWQLHDFHLHSAARYAVRMRNAFNPDSGDGSILAGEIYPASTGEGLRFESGGGPKASHVKVLGGTYAYDVAMADGAVTSDLFVDETNSFENQTTAAVILQCGGPNGTGKLNGARLYMQTTAPGSGGTTGLTATGCMQSVDVDGTYGGFSTGLSFTGGAKYNVHPRSVDGITGVGLNIGAGVLNTAVPYFPRVTFNKSTGSGYYNIIDNRSLADDTASTPPTSAANNPQIDGDVYRHDVRYLNMAQGAAQTLYAVGVPNNRGARARIELEGIVQNVGHVHIVEDVLLDNTGAGTVAPTIVTSAGTTSALTITFAPSGSSYNVNMAVATNSNTSATNSFQGSMTIDVTGKTNAWQIL